MRERASRTGSVFSRRDARGRVTWYVDYRNAEGVRKRTRAGFTKREAEESLRRLITEREAILKGDLTEAQRKTTMGQARDHWLFTKRGVKGSTYARF